MKRLVLFGCIVFLSLKMHAQAHIATSIKVVGGKIRIAVKAVGGSITGQPSNFIFVLAIPVANGSVSPGPITKLEAAGSQHVPLNPDASNGVSFSDDSLKYFWYSYIDAAASVTFAQDVEYDILEVGPWVGPIQTAQVRLVSLPNGTGNPTPPSSDGLWLAYWEVSGVQYTNPDVGSNLFYQSASSTAVLNGESYGVFSSVMTSSSVTLPVSLYNFSGYKSGTANVLKWTTSSEMNSKGFEVMRSSQGTDYTSLGFVNSRAVNGTSNKELAYTFEDNSPLAAKKSYYRLRLVDLDARTAMSNIIIINGEKPKTMEIGGLFPNPANDKLNVIVSAPQRGNVTLAVMDINGKMISQKLINVEAGSNTVPVEISQLAKGNYLVKVVDRSSGIESTASKFVKQ